MVSDIGARTVAIKELSDVVAPIAAKYHIIAVYLLGSRARDDYGDECFYGPMISMPDRVIEALYDKYIPPRYGFGNGSLPDITYMTILRMPSGNFS